MDTNERNLMDASFISDMLAKNSYVNSFFYKHWKNAATQNAVTISRRMRNDDSIADISTLRKLRQEVESGRTWIPGDINVANSLNYGIKHALFPFDDNHIQRPSIEHGLIFYEDVFQDVLHTASMACATMAPFRSTIIQAKRQIPVFAVGPYIQYAKPFYDERKAASYKQKHGKILLVFPAHSTDLSSISFDEGSYIDLVKGYAKNFDTVCICSFWWNINDSLIQKFESEGFKIVSAGFRDDISFLSRLRTILETADLVIGNNIGTHIGYCHCLGVPFELADIKSHEETSSPKEMLNTDIRKKRFDEIKQALHSNDSSAINRCMAFYWGSNISRTSHERMVMCEITTDLLEETKGFFSRIPEVSSKLLNKYHSSGSITHSTLLEEAIQHLPSAKRHKRPISN